MSSRLTIYLFSYGRFIHYIHDAISVMDAVKGLWQSVVSTKRAYLNPHEHFGR